MALTDHDLSELLDALRAGEMTDTIRTSLEWVLQQLIEAEAAYLKGRVRGRVVSRAVVVATGVTSTGDREVLGVEVGDSEDQAFWAAFFKGLRSRGLGGVQLVISDHHLGLKAAIAAVFVGAAWQRSSVHHPRRRLDVVEACMAGGMVPLVAPRRRERALAA